MSFLRKKISLYSPVKCPQKKKIQGSLAIGMAPLLFTTLCGAGVHHACLWKKRRFLNFGFLNPGKTAVLGRASRKNTKTRFWSLDIHITHDKLTKPHSESVRTHPANQASCFARNKRKPQETRTLSNPRINPTQYNPPAVLVQPSKPMSSSSTAGWLVLLSTSKAASAATKSAFRPWNGSGRHARTSFAAISAGIASLDAGMCS